MNKKALGIWGAGGLGREVLELAKIINQNSKRWSDFVFIVDGVTVNEISGIKVMEYNDAKQKYLDKLEVAIGIGEPVIRKQKFDQLEKDGVTVPTLVHPDVYIPESTTVGKGAVIQYGCFISCNVVINDHVYIQPQCNIGHDDVLGRGCMISSFANIAGAVDIGEDTYLGMSTTIKEGVSIGSYTIVGMGSIVHRDIPDEMIAMGNPARPMKPNTERKVFKH